MLELRKANDRGYADHGWLKSHECREGLAVFDGLVDRIVLGGSWVGSQDAMAENHQRLLRTFRPAG